MDVFDPQIFDVENDILWALAEGLSWFVFVELFFSTGGAFPVAASERSPPTPARTRRMENDLFMMSVIIITIYLFCFLEPHV